MISFFPSPYPDELWYSVICRYHVHSGNYCAKHTMRQLYGDYFQCAEPLALRPHRHIISTTSTGILVRKGHCNATHILSLLRTIFSYATQAFYLCLCHQWKSISCASYGHFTGQRKSLLRNALLPRLLSRGLATIW